MQFEQDKQAAITWARNVLSKSFLILDTETTGLHDAKPVQIAVIDHEGNSLLDTLLWPLAPIEPEAQAIHGITDEMCKSAPDFRDIYPKLRRILYGQNLIIYNAAYDWPIIDRQCDLYKVDRIPLQTLTCAMEWYAQYFGEWNDYRQNYKWQKLPGGDHSALGDCRAVLALIKRMANL